jgi:PAS domain S-box-containing protein
MNIESEPTQAQLTRSRGTARTRILIVEDEAVVARDLERSLSDMGYEVIASVASSDDAMRAAAQRRPDIVLLDIRIQGAIDGIDTADRLRKLYRVPVVFLTAYSDDTTLGRAALTEPYGYVVKPFTTREVRSAIEIARYKHAVDVRMAARERWFSTTLRSIGDAVVACDAERRVHFMNRAAEQLTGWSEHEANGRPVDEVMRLTSGSEPILVSALIERALLRREPQSLPPNTQLLQRDGKGSRIIDDSAAPIISEDQLLGTVLVIRDVTEQRVLQEKMVISERLSSLGTLAAGICHEINNPLTFVVANVHVIESAIEGWRQQLRVQGPLDLAERTLQAEEALEDVRQGAERIRRIVSDLSAFGRPLDDSRITIDVRESVEWALRVAASQLRSRAKLIKDLRPVPPVRADDTKLVQVLINLLVNAAQAIPEGDAERNTVRVCTDIDQSGHVVIEVADSGCGIAADTLPRIFDPFFTTKDPGRGSGLGLSICHGIVQSFGGGLSVQSTEGLGSVFKVSLPAAVSNRGGSAATDAAAGPQRRGRLLVVDDEVGFLRAVKALYGDEHDVVVTADPREALRMMEEGERFDIVLCDMMMAGFNGMDLYEAVRQRFPAMAERFVFATGGAFTPRAISFLQAVSNERIQKPFDPDALRKLLQRALHTR